MRYYDTYAHLLGVPYDDGDHDCYGLCRRFYSSVFDVELPNYARSSDFFGSHVGLIRNFLDDTEFEVKDVPSGRLSFGDGLLFAVPHRSSPSGSVNHMGVFVGNGLFIHRLHGKVSCEEAMTPQWARRIMGVVQCYEVEVAAAKLFTSETVDVLSLIPEHVKHRHGIALTASALEPYGREVRPASPDGSGSGVAQPEQESTQPTPRRPRRTAPVQG